MGATSQAICVNGVRDGAGGKGGMPWSCGSEGSVDEDTQLQGHEEETSHFLVSLVVAPPPRPRLPEQLHRQLSQRPIRRDRHSPPAPVSPTGKSGAPARPGDAQFAGARELGCDAHREQDREVGRFQGAGVTMKSACSGGCARPAGRRSSFAVSVAGARRRSRAAPRSERRRVGQHRMVGARDHDVALHQEALVGVFPPGPGRGCSRTRGRSRPCRARWALRVFELARPRRTRGASRPSMRSSGGRKIVSPMSVRCRRKVRRARRS